MENAKLEQVAEQAVVEQPREVSRKEWKNLMRQYFTVRHPELSCGHKFSGEPKNNCELCWVTFFQHNLEMVQTAHQIWSKEGPHALTSMRGAKFTKMFGRFMATLVRLEHKMQEQNDNSKLGSERTTGEQGEVQADSSSGEGA